MLEEGEKLKQAVEDDAESPRSSGPQHEDAINEQEPERNQATAPFKGPRGTARAFMAACNTIIQTDSTSVPLALTEWLDDIQAKLDKPNAEVVRGLPLSTALGIVAAAVSSVIMWFATQSIIVTVYMGLGLGLGIFGVARYLPECSAVGGILAKTLAWYLAPSLENLTSVTRYFISVALAAFLEYPFLTFSNGVALRRRTAMRLRAIQDAADVVASFILVALSGLGVVNAFSIAQTLLALLRVAVAVFGPAMCLQRPASSENESRSSIVLLTRQKQLLLMQIARLYPKVKPDTLKNDEIAQWIRAREDEMANLPEESKTDRMRRSCSKEACVCFGITALGLILGGVGFSLATDPYTLGLAAVCGMGLAWYVGPSLRDHDFIVRWIISVCLTASLEYPFLVAANSRGAEQQVTFELRAVQDLASLIVGTVLIVVLGRVSLNIVDWLQLSIGVLRVVVATRFFGAFPDSSL